MRQRLSATLSRLLYAHPRGRLGLLLGPAVAWLLMDPRLAAAHVGATGGQRGAAAILVVSLPLIAVAAYLMRDEGAGARVAQGE